MLTTTFWSSLALTITAGALSAAQQTPFTATQHEPVVDTGYAKYRGNLTFPDSVAYLGIPYAEPPVGDLRFRAPVPLNTSRIQEEAGGKVIDASEYPDSCIQWSFGTGDTTGASEDCLKVNIYAPLKATADSKLPVLVYFHGGGYVFGNPRAWPYDGWIHQDQEVVIVSVYYRLEAFGFLAHPDFVDSSFADLNGGFLDQVQSLKWVKANIASFGGDPSRVTIDGESAGGGSVQLHLVAEESEELFQAAIAQSVYRIYVGTADERVPQFNSFASSAGCSDGSIAERMACLRNVPVSTLAKAQDAASDVSVGPYHLFIPVVDKKVIIENPTKAVLEGNFKKVPLLIGATSDESLSDPTTLGPPLQVYFPKLSDATVARYEEVYPLSDFGDNETVRNMVAHGDSELRCARSILAKAFSSAGVPTFTYRFNEANPTSGSPLVAHAAENWWMFQGQNIQQDGSTAFTPMTPPQEAFAEELIAYWLSFVRSHDPSTFKLDRSPEWPAFANDERNRIVLNMASDDWTKSSGSMLEKISDTETAQCDFVASIQDEQEN